MTTAFTQVSNSGSPITESDVMCSMSRLFRARQLVILVVLGGVSLGSATNISSAQPQTPTPIQVETREVVLPILVFREKKDPKAALISPDGQWYPTWRVYAERVNDLTTKSVHIFEDGLPQKIESFAPQAAPFWLVTDNLGVHLQQSLTPKGIWAGPDKDKVYLLSPWEPFQWYLLTYIQPSSPVGSCHRITLKVDRRNATVLAPDRYCNTNAPLSDPLNGAELGNKLLEYANSGQSGTLPLAVQLSSFLDSSGEYRVNVSAAIPADLLNRKWEANRLVTSIAILGLVYDKEQALVARFSDALCRPPGCEMFYEGALQPKNTNLTPILGAEKYFADISIPSAYQTQLDLGPGDYRLDLILTDGEKFGRATASVTVYDFSKGDLTISGIAICKRYHAPSADEKGPTRSPQYISLVSDGIEFTPAGDTKFRKGEPFISFFEVYGLQRDGIDVSAHLQVKITDVKTGVVKLNSGVEPLKLSSSPNNRSIPVVRKLSIDTLSPGFYRLEAQVSDSEGHKTGWREASFTVE